MKKFVYLMSLVALLFCYSCNSSESGGNKEKILSLCGQGIKIYNEAIDKMRVAEYPDEFEEICRVYERRLDRWEEEAENIENSVSEEETKKLLESDDEVARAHDELKIIQFKFYNMKYKKLEFGMQ